MPFVTCRDCKLPALVKAFSKGGGFYTTKKDAPDGRSEERRVGKEC